MSIRADATWLERANHAAQNPADYLTPVTAEEYAALSRIDRLLRGYAASTVRRRWYKSSARARWMLDHCDDPCIDCGGWPITCDHVVPIVRGGSSFPSNLAPRCGSCNSRKGAR